jgi:hypothetical protein
MVEWMNENMGWEDEGLVWHGCKFLVGWTNHNTFLELVWRPLSPSHVLKCCTRHEGGRTITIPFGSFLFGTFARFFGEFFNLSCSFFLCAKEANDDNYYCDNSHPNNIIGFDNAYIPTLIKVCWPNIQYSCESCALNDRWPPSRPPLCM